MSWLIKRKTYKDHFTRQTGKKKRKKEKKHLPRFLDLCSNFFNGSGKEYFFIRIGEEELSPPSQGAVVIVIFAGVLGS